MEFLSTRKHGFTIVEMIVSVAVFSVVVTISVGALMVLIGTNEQLQSEQSVMTNLSFALDSMTREIRTGTHYFCNSRNNFSAGGPNSMFNNGNNVDTVLGDDTQDCHNGNNSGHRLQGIAFREGGDSVTGSAERILYFYDEDEGKLFRRVGDGDAQSIVSSGIYIEHAEFYVTGSAPQDAGAGGDDVPAMVTIYIQAREKDDPETKTYDIQTTVTQRVLDI